MILLQCILPYTQSCDVKLCRFNRQCVVYLAHKIICKQIIFGDKYANIGTHKHRNANDICDNNERYIDLRDLLFCYIAVVVVCHISTHCWQTSNHHCSRLQLIYCRSDLSIDLHLWAFKTHFFLSFWLININPVREIQFVIAMR